MIFRTIALAAAMSLTASGWAADAKTAARANNQFGLGLFQKTKATTAKGNRFLSPASAYLALAIAYNGTVGETRKQMEEVLGLSGLSRDEINEANAELVKTLTEGNDFTLEIANALWARRGLRLKADYINRVEDSYQATLDELDFQAPEASRIINDWVKEKTNGKIDSIVGNRLPGGLVVFIANAVYFDAKWSLPFDPNNTRKRPFHASTGPVNVPMMSETANYRYSSGAFGEAVELPYGRNGNVSMFVVEPEGDLDTFIHNLDRESWERLVGKVHRSPARYGSVTLPSLELKYEGELNQPLQDLGMQRAFSRAAEFDDLAHFPGGQNAQISKVLQKTYLKVFEEGTIAAAVTGISVGITSVPPAPQFHMVVDKPYLIAIRDNRSGALLFLGSVKEPEGGKLPERS